MRRIVLFECSDIGNPSNSIFIIPTTELLIFPDEWIINLYSWKYINKIMAAKELFSCLGYPQYAEKLHFPENLIFTAPFQKHVVNTITKKSTKKELRLIRNRDGFNTD